MKRWVNRRHATVAKLAATSLVVTLLGTMHQAAFADSISSGNGITFGQVFSNGEPESGVTVTAVIWPKSSILANLSAGAPVTRLNAGSVATNSNGTFEVDISPTSISSDYKENDGSVSVELYVADPRGPYNGGTVLGLIPRPVPIVTGRLATRQLMTHRRRLICRSTLARVRCGTPTMILQTG